MRITIAAIGRIKAGPLRALQDHYAGRIGWPLEVREIEERKRLAPDRLKQREAELLLKACPAGAIVVALDDGGRQLTSTAFADRIGGWRDDGVSDIAFLIGGADGLGAAALKRADQVLSLGAMTWPHLMVRGMLLEQLYRAQQILAGHPYHRE